MITITRLPEPSKLTEKKDKWLAAYLKKKGEVPKHRPPSGQYAHKEIRDILERMSNNKCFYCECKLGEDSEMKSEVDHYIEVAEQPKLAFDWNNLYLSCYDCNRKKLSNATMPVSNCLNPCDTAENPADHLTFKHEYIRPRANSSKGCKTIKKYKLDRSELNYSRLKWVQRFEHFLRKLRERQLDNEGRKLTLREREAVNSFKEPHHAFSLMFRVYLTCKLF